MINTNVFGTTGHTLVVLTDEMLNNALVSAYKQGRIEVDEERKKENEQSEGLVTNKQFKRELGISDATLWRWQKNGMVTPIYFGGKKMWKRADLRKLIEGRA